MSKSRRNYLKALVILAASTGLASTALGQGYGGAVLTPNSLDFGTVLVGTTSASQNISVSTPSTDGISSLSIVSIVLPAGYVRSGGTCPVSGSAPVPCTIGIAFVPTAAGAQPGNVVVTASVFGGPQAVSNAALTGTGILAQAVETRAVPSLNQWGLGLLLASLMTAGIYLVRKR